MRITVVTLLVTCTLNALAWPQGGPVVKKPHIFSDTCPDCTPAILNVTTGAVVPATDPMMIAVMRVWRGKTTLAQRRAYINVTVHNSTRAEDQRLCQQVMSLIAAAMEAR